MSIEYKGCTTLFTTIIQSETPGRPNTQEGRLGLV